MCQENKDLQTKSVATMRFRTHDFCCYLEIASVWSVVHNHSMYATVVALYYQEQLAGRESGSVLYTGFQTGGFFSLRCGFPL